VDGDAGAGRVIRVLIVDDHPALRAGLRAILDTAPDLAVAGEAGDGAEAVDRARAFRPDVVLMDLEMPGHDGVAATRALRAEQPEARVIVFTAFDTDDRIVAAIEAGATGYLLKGAPREEIFRAVRVAATGGALLQPAVASKLLQHMTAVRPAAGDLSEREREVLALLVEGLTNKEIAARLTVSRGAGSGRRLSERTVKYHVASIMAKLEVSSRAAAVREALARRLV
jgi:DNA-binding NarL/FixJ family response regulator